MKMDHELIEELEFAYQKVYEKEVQLKERGHSIRNGMSRYKTISEVRDSEARYRRLFEAAQDGILILDAETGEITDANPYITESLGYPLQDLIGKRLWEIGAFVDVKDSKAAFEELQRKQYIRYENLPLRTNSGEIKEVEFISNVYFVNSKKVIQCNIRDITARKQTEEALHQSEQRYRRLFETAQDGILILDAETGVITDANPYITKSLGYPLQDLLGKRLWEIGAFDDVKESKAAFEELQRREYIRYEDLPLRTKQGKSREVEFISNVYLVNGKKIIQCNIRDITERKQTEEALHESEQRYRRLFETAQDGILILDAETGVITDANPYITESLGYPLEDLVGKQLWEIGAFVDVKDSKAAFEELQRKEYIRYEDLPLRTKHGESREVEFISNVYLVNGKKVIQCNIRDITERKLTEEVVRDSEERFRMVFEHVFDGISIYSEDPDVSKRKLVECNERYAAMAGRSREELFKLGNTENIVKNYDPLSNNNRLESLTKGTAYQGSFSWIRPDGKENIIEYVAMPITWQGKSYSIGIDRDITERRMAEKNLQKSEERYRRLVEYSPNAIMVHNSGKFVYVNPVAIALLGAHNEMEILGKPVIDIIHPDCRELWRQRVNESTNENKPLPLVELKFLRLDGTAIIVEVAALPIEYDGVRSMQDVVRDISEQKKLQLELLQSQKIQSIGTLAGGIAHDFNNILGIILGYTSLIEKSTLNAVKLFESSEAIKQAVQRGAALVKQILTFASKTEISFEPLSLLDLVQELVSMLQQTFPKIINFQKEFPDDTPLIFADRTQMLQALLNLCVNARDAMPHGGTITISAEMRRGKELVEQFPTAKEKMYVCISVTDTGEGMDKATSRRVFDPFFTTKAHGKGTGLGLSVVYGVVQTHKGFINVESELGRGTIFRLYFPVSEKNVKLADRRKVKPFEIGGTEMILLVEDEKLLLEMVRFTLESKGYKVVVAHDGGEAVDVYKLYGKEISLVITDIGLPVMTGIEEFKRLKEINPDVKVIFASGYFDPELKSELLKSGVKEFLQKPYQTDEILRALRNVLDNKN